MKTPTTTARPIRRQHTLAEQQSLRFRAELPALPGRRPQEQMQNALHDFLVPNPRPDLTMDSDPLSHVG